MKMPDEIKKGLEACVAGECNGKGHKCPYRDEGECTSTLAKDALAYIQQLKAKVPKWISVEDRLPERHGQMCVGLYNQHGAPRSILFSHVFTWYAFGDNGYVNGPHFSDEGLDGLKVWYWMPLPEPPKGEM